MNYYGYLYIYELLWIFVNYYGYHDSRCHGHMGLTHTHTPLPFGFNLWWRVTLLPWPHGLANGDLWFLIARVTSQKSCFCQVNAMLLANYLSVVWTSDFIAITKKTQCWCTMHIPLCTPFSGSERFLVGKIMINTIGVLAHPSFRQTHDSSVATFMNKLKMNNCVAFCCI